jgi:hypothetical protein
MTSADQIKAFGPTTSQLKEARAYANGHACRDNPRPGSVAVEVAPANPNGCKKYVDLQPRGAGGGTGIVMTPVVSRRHWCQWVEGRAVISCHLASS